jgi:hypothetical protein
MNTTTKKLALKCGQALHGGDSKTALSAANDYLIEAISDSFQSFSGWGDESPSELAQDFYNSGIENLEVEVLDYLAASIPDAQWNEDENQKLVADFIALVKQNAASVIDQATDGQADSRAHARDPYAYHGVKRSDF